MHCTAQQGFRVNQPASTFAPRRPRAFLIQWLPRRLPLWPTWRAPGAASSDSYSTVPYTVREGFRGFSHVLFLVLPATEAPHVFNARAAAAAAAVADLARACYRLFWLAQGKSAWHCCSKGVIGFLPLPCWCFVVWCGPCPPGLHGVLCRSPHPHTRPSYQKCLQLPLQLPRVMQRQPSKIERVLLDSFTYKAVHVTAQCCTVQLDCMSVVYLA